MQLCDCPRPVRSLAAPDRLRCHQCGGWTPHGRTSPPIIDARIGETIRLLEHVSLEYVRSEGLVPAPQGTRVAISRSGHGDPTGSTGASHRAQQINAWRLLAACCAARAREWARHADAAIGMAWLTAETNRTPDHTKAPYHEAIPAGRPDLEEAYAARDRRHARGEP